MIKSNSLCEWNFIQLIFIITIIIFGTGCVSDKTECVSDDNSRVINAQPIPVFSVPNTKHKQASLDFIALGDVGKGNKNQKRVAKSMNIIAKAFPVKFVLLLGDNFYNWGVESIDDKQWESKFKKVYNLPDLKNLRFYSILGNHDYYGNPEAQVSYTKTQGKTKPQWWMPSRYYTFIKKIDSETNVQFFAIDTDPIINNSFGHQVQIKWLENELKKSKSKWKIVLGHHPIYSGGYHGNYPQLKKKIEPILIKYKVDLYLAGHDHDMQLLKPVGGVNHIVSGAGAKSRDVEWKKNTLYAATNFGFTFFRITKNKLLAAFVRLKGRIEYSQVIAHKPSRGNRKTASP